MLESKDLNALGEIFLIIQQYNAANISIMDALGLYEKSCQRAKIKKILESVRHDVGTGMHLPDAFDKHPKFFPNYIVEMMRVNEGTGQSERIYENIVASIDQEIDLRRNVGSNFINILFISVFLFITIGIVFFVLLPNLAKMMSSFHTVIPVYTRVMLWMGTVSLEYWWLILMMLVALIVAGCIFKKQFPEKFALFILTMPLYGEIVSCRQQYRFAMLFGLCKEAGLDTIKALQYTQYATDNYLMYELLNRTIHDLVRKGGNLTNTLKEKDTHHILDESYFMILAAGEKSDIAALMKMRANFYRKKLIVISQEFGEKLNHLIITPTFVIMGLIVVAATFPIFSFMEQIVSGGGFGM